MVKSIRVCPYCESSKITTAVDGLGDAFGMQKNYTCMSCNKIFPMYIVVKAESEKELKTSRQHIDESENYVKEELPPQTFGKFYAKHILPISGVILSFLAIFVFSSGFVGSLIFLSGAAVCFSLYFYSMFKK